MRTPLPLRIASRRISSAHLTEVESSYRKVHPDGMVPIYDDAMAAFRRRTTFAAPLVITVAASCSTKQREQPPPPPGPPTWTVTMRDMKCHAQKQGEGGAPQAIMCPPGMSGDRTMTVVERAPGRCVAMPGNLATACPLPPGQPLVEKLGIVWTIERRGEHCHAEEEDHDCPPGVDCNPPKPRTFPCPPGVTEDKPLHVAELRDATCVIVPDGCTDTGCAAEKVACPPEGAR